MAGKKRGSKKRGAKKRTAKKRGTTRKAKGQIPLEVLEERAKRLTALVHKRGGTF